MHIAVIGAGASGLCAARHVIANGLECTLFEQMGELGGTWVYTEQIGVDEYGLPVHSSMYEGLRTNLPKELMGFPDFPVPENEKSYLPQKYILKFLDLYAINFGVKQHIKFYNHVNNVKPLAGSSRWEIVSTDVRSKETTRYEFDAVIVCNGHYHTPLLPQLHGIEQFTGRKCHSHDYRKPDHFAGENVLIIGAGPSGLDLALQISAKANKVFLSHHSKEPITTVFPDNLLQRPDVKEVKQNTVEFVDGVEESVNCIFYCTGYKYSFPFLDESCGVTVDDNYIQPLYKHIVNIQHPTMGFIGVPFYVCTFHMFDLQARFLVELLKGNVKLPSKEEMQIDTETEMQSRWKRGYTKRQAHMMGPDQKRYYNDLATTAKLSPIPPVMIELHTESMKRFLNDFVNFRDDVYKIIDDNSFIRIPGGNSMESMCRCQASMV